MSENQFSALIAKLKDDSALRDKLQGCADLDAAVSIAKEAGFDVSKADWIRYQAAKTTELSDAELEHAAGGVGWLTQCGGSFLPAAGDRPRLPVDEILRGGNNQILGFKRMIVSENTRSFMATQSDNRPLKANPAV